MSIFKNIHNKENHRLNFFLNIFTIIILVWIYPSHDDIFTYGRTIENKNKRIIGINIYFNRYLAEYVGETQIDKTGLHKNSPYYFENDGTSNYDEYLSIYRNMKNSDSKKLKLYKTSYNHRYSKKKGLSKLDCYYENKIFKKIDYLYNLANNWNKDKKSFKKMILNKYSIYIFFTLLPALGLIYPILFGIDDKRQGIFGLCKQSGHKVEGGNHKILEDSEEKCPEYWLYENETLITSIGYINYIISSILSIISLLVIIYILLKIIKYERLKDGKDKMNKKEYFNYSKQVFNLK